MLGLVLNHISKGDTGDITTNINAAHFGKLRPSTGIEAIPRAYPYV